MSSRKLLNYTLFQELGQGGMATVWYAENSVGRPFAIKLLNPRLMVHDPSIAVRFRNEAQIMVRLDHPVVRRVEDYYTLRGVDYRKSKLLKVERKQVGYFQ